MMAAVLWDESGQTTILRLLASAVERWPDRKSFDVVGDIATYRDIDRESNKLANGLAALGIKKGDTVSTMLDTSLDALLVLYAIVKLGAISAPINTSFKGEFLRHQLADTAAKVLIAEDEYTDRILELADRLPDARTLLYRGAKPQAATRLDVIPLEQTKQGRADPIVVDVQPDDLAMLIYTSGTTGPSKGCMVPHNYVCNMGRLNVDGYDLTENDVLWSPLPFFHVNAINNVVGAAALSGARVALAKRFSLSGFWPDVERTGATVVSLIGSMIALIANAPDTDVSKRCFGKVRAAKGAPFSEALKAIWRERFGVRHAGAPGYGMTEMTMITMYKISKPSPPGTSGRRFADYDVRIVDDRGFECPPGVPGEIIARPMRPNIMFQGYWRRPEATQAVMRDMWFHTGDIGSIDAEGFFTFIDRKKDYLRKGGENISSFEMETAFRDHPDIDDVAVHAVRSELSEDEVKVTAVLKPGSNLSAEALCRWCLDRVPHFAVPRYIEFRPDLPRNPIGRVLKYELRDQGVTAATWDRSKSDVVVKR